MPYYNVRADVTAIYRETVQADTAADAANMLGDMIRAGQAKPIENSGLTIDNIRATHVHPDPGRTESP